MSTSLTELPNEIILAVVKQVHRQRDLNYFAQATRHIYEIVNAELYRRDAASPDRWALSWASWRGVKNTAVKALNAGSPVDGYGECMAWNRQKPHRFDHTTRKPLDAALSNSHLDIVRLLINFGASQIQHRCLDKCIEHDREDALASIVPYLPSILEGRNSWLVSGGRMNESREFAINKMISTALKCGRADAFEKLLSVFPFAVEGFRAARPQINVWTAARSGSLELLTRALELSTENGPSYDRTLEDLLKHIVFPKGEKGVKFAESLQARYPRLKIAQNFHLVFKKLCADGNSVVLKWLLAMDEVSDQQRLDCLSDRTCMKHAVRSKDVETFQIFVSAGLIRKCDLFDMAGVNEVFSMINAFGEAGHDVQTSYSDAFTHLHAAAASGDDQAINQFLDTCCKTVHSDIFKMFYCRREISRQGDVLFPHSFSFLKLQGGRRVPSCATMRRLFSLGAILNHDESSATYLMLRVCGEAALFPEEYPDIQDLLELLLSQGADINASVMLTSGYESATALHAACLGDNDTVVRLLLEHGARVDGGKLTRTALHEACTKHNLPAVSLLLEHGAGAALASTEYLTPLELACNTPMLSPSRDSKQRFFGIAKLLLDQNIEPTSRNVMVSAALHSVCRTWNSDMNVLYLLIDNGADIETRGLEDRTPLHTACAWHNTAAARVLLDAGADMNAKDVKGETPIYKVFDGPLAGVDWGHGANIVDLLLCYGADAKGLPVRTMMQEFALQTELQEVFKRHGMFDDIV